MPYLKHCSLDELLQSVHAEIKSHFLNEFIFIIIIHDRCSKWCAVKWAGPADASYDINAGFPLRSPCILLTCLNHSFSLTATKLICCQNLEILFYFLTLESRMTSFFWPGPLMFYSSFLIFVSYSQLLNLTSLGLIWKPYSHKWYLMSPYYDDIIKVK